MNFFDDTSVVCLCCDTRTRRTDIAVRYDDAGICSKCYKKLVAIPYDSPFEGRRNTDFVLSPFYYNRTMKSLIHKYKFYDCTRLGDIFSIMLLEFLKNHPVINEFDFICAMPLSYKKMLKRGYNQSEILALMLCEKLNIPYVQCVYRKNDTQTQSTLSGFQRRINTKDAFIADKSRCFGKSILLFDDVYTTGSTMDSCARELKNKGAKRVVGISLAITRK